jgi:hypothetical protein
MVRLGASIDQSGLNRFHQALKEATSVSEASAASIAGAFFKAQSEIVGGFLAIGTAALGLVDKVAMADQSYRLFALHMYMSKDAARSLKVAMDALGEPLENLTWDPELRKRTAQLIADQRAMAPEGAGTDFESQMRKVRDIRFEFTRMEVEGQYLAMNVVEGFMKALGVGPDELLGKLQKFNDWVTHNLPEISSKIVTLFMPVWKDMKDVFTSVWTAVKATGVAFTDFVGLISGDRSIEGGTFNLEKFAAAVVHVAHGFAVFAEAVANIEELLADFIGGLAGDNAAADAFFDHWKAKTVGLILGGAAGGIAGSFLGPWGTAMGVMLGAGIGANVADKLGGPAPASAGGIGANVADKLGGPAPASAGNTGSNSAAMGVMLGAGIGANVADKLGGPAPASAGNTGSNSAAMQAAQTAQEVSRATGIRSDLIWSQWAHETGGFTHIAAANNLAGIRLPGTTTYQQFSSPAEFAKRYAEIAGESRYAGLSGAQDAAQFAHILKAGGYYEGPEKDYAAGMGRFDRMYTTGGGSSVGQRGGVQVGTMTININKPSPSNDEVAGVVVSRLQDVQGKAVQRNLSEFQDLSYSY